MLTTLLLALSFLASQGAPTGVPSDVLCEADRAFCRATRERGLEGWLAAFAPDAVVFPPEGDLAAGTEALRRHYSGLGGFPPAGFVWEPEEAGLSAERDLGWTIGRWGNDSKGNATWSGRYLSLWRRTADGRWEVVADGAYEPLFAKRLPGLSGPPVTEGRERTHAFRSARGDLEANLGSWWATDGQGTEVGGKYLALWRRGADGAHELVAETGIVQPRR